jgi:hypothetical protein
MNSLVIRVESSVRVYLSFLLSLTMGVAKNEGGNPILFYILVKKETISKVFVRKISENLAFKP